MTSFPYPNSYGPHIEHLLCALEMCPNSCLESLGRGCGGDSGSFLILLTSTVSADTEVVGGDGQHHTHLGPGSCLLLPSSHLHRSHHLQVLSPLWLHWQEGGFSVSPPVHFWPPFYSICPVFPPLFTLFPSPRLRACSGS